MNRKRAHVEIAASALAFTFTVGIAFDRSALAANPSSALPACTDEVHTLVRALDDWSHRFHEHEDHAYAEHRCSDPAVFCLDRFGKNGRDALPSRVPVGQSLDVSVIYPAIDSATLALSASVRASTALHAGSEVHADSVHGAAPEESKCKPTADDLRALQIAALPIATLGARPGFDALGVPRDASSAAYWSNADGAAIVAAWTAWAAAHHDSGFDYASLDARVDVLYGDTVARIDFSRTEAGERAPSATAHHDIVVDNGRYHLELSVLVPVVYHGERRATLTPAANASELRVGIESDWHVTGALMLDLFPFGRQKGELTSFRECRSRSCFENWLGLQFGTGFDHPARDWYFGLVFEPVSGVALGAGVAVLKGEFLGPGLAEGMLLPSASSLSVDSHYMARPYIGLAVTTDIFHAIDRGSISTRALR